MAVVYSQEIGTVTSCLLCIIAAHHPQHSLSFCPHLEVVYKAPLLPHGRIHHNDSSALHQLQAQVSGSLAMEDAHLQGSQHIHRRHVCLRHKDAHHVPHRLLQRRLVNLFIVGSVCGRVYCVDFLVYVYTNHFVFQHLCSVHFLHHVL